MANDAKLRRPRRSNKGGGASSGRSVGSAPVPTSPKSGSSRIANLRRSYERYLSLAQAAMSAGDAVEIENHYQHAEHYLRQMREQAG